MDWIFDGIGTEIIGNIISLIIGGLGGGLVGYKIAIKKVTKQKQKAGNNSEQSQELHIKGDINNKEYIRNNIKMKQFQKAGKNSVQSQIGGISDD